MLIPLVDLKLAPTENFEALGEHIGALLL